MDAFWTSELGQNAVKYWYAPEPELLRDLINDPTKDEYWYQFYEGYSHGYVRAYPNAFVTLALLYVPCLILGKLYMRNREPFQLKTPLLVWNLLSCVLSGLGAIPITRYVIQDFGRLTTDFQAHLCDIRPYATTVGFVVDVFIITKVFEWVDTIFLVFRKKKIIFLHWFHHLMTAVYCWLAGVYIFHSDSSGLWFAGMNLWVHFIMYGYYGLTTLGLRFRLSFLITLLQTLQMVMGVFVVLRTPGCPNSWPKIGVYFYIGLFMYSVYLLLFAKLLIEKFALAGGGKRSKLKSSKKDA